MLALRTPEGKTVPSGMMTKSWPLALNPGTGPSRVFAALPSRINLLGGGTSDFASLYRTQPWCYAVINKLVRTIASLELKTYEYDDSRTPIEAPLAVPAKVLRSPYPGAGSFQLKEFIIGSLCVYGNATLVKARGGSGQTPNELWPMPFQRVQIIQGRERPIEAYQYMGLNENGAVRAVPKTFLPDDVVHFSWFNADGQPWGRSPLEALATSLALEDAGQRYSLSNYGNNARPASFIVSDQKLSKEQRENLRAEIDSAYGGPDNAFKVALLDNGLDWKPIGHSSRDISLVENRKFSREEVCAAYDISPMLVGILDNGTFNNMDAAIQMLYQVTIAPILSMLDDTLNAQFVNEAAWSDFFVRFDMGEAVRGNLETRSQGWQRMFNCGMKTPNELRKMEGDPPIGNPLDKDNPANMIYVPVNTAPVGQDGMLKPMGQPTALGATPDPVAPAADDTPKVVTTP
jgi:HK97 family phage portal protein